MPVIVLIYVFNIVLFISSTVALTVIFYEKINFIQKLKTGLIFFGLIVFLTSLYTIIQFINNGSHHLQKAPFFFAALGLSMLLSAFLKNRS